MPPFVAHSPVCAPTFTVNDKGYVCDWRDTLLPKVLPEDFEDDLRAGGGNELREGFRCGKRTPPKFCAVHSSSGLAVNCFSPFRQRIADLTLPKNGPFETLQFEQKCPTGLRGRRPPNLDVLLTGPGGVVGIESKLTEHLKKQPKAEFSPDYAEQIIDERRKQGFFREMLRLRDRPKDYVWLDAAQLIKHAFGLAHRYGGRPVTLLYLFWEPANPKASPEFEEHRQEITRFAERVAESRPEFRAMSYPELWRHWREAACPPAWLIDHVNRLDERYSIPI